MSLAPILLSAALVAAPGVAAPLPTAVAPGCEVSAATLHWGFKESFRAYLDSDIANGAWTTADGATYETPEFAWSDGYGRYNPEDGTGYIEFTGSVRFTGHDGLLDTTIKDPFLRLDGDSAVLILDVAGPTMDGDLFARNDVEFVTLPTAEVVGDDAERTLEAPTALTETGAEAFPNYPAGEAFDPVSIAMTVGKVCASASGDYDATDTRSDGSLLIAALAAGILVVVAAVVGVFVLTRRRRA